MASLCGAFLFYKFPAKDYKILVNSWSRIKQKIKKAPRVPGVYIFYRHKKPLYIGKASDLKNRLQSYLPVGNFKNDRLHKDAVGLKFFPLRSEIEALIEEAKLIKKLNPSYNILWRDDKSYFYVILTKEKFPRIFVAHKNLLHSAYYILHSHSIGPFTEGRALKFVLRMLRRNFPYCTCPKPHLRVCLNAQIGNCDGLCCKKDAKPTLAQVKNYRKNIRVIKNFLIGKPLKKFTKNLKLEEREALEKILAHREFLDYQTQINADKRRLNISVHPRNNLRKSALIEGYDISHLAGREVVAGMTAWEFNGETLFPRKDFWRKFIIRTAKPADDPGAIAETVSRRLNHPEWPYPDVFVIDGGLSQWNAARKVVENFGMSKKIRVVSFAKPGQSVYGLAEHPILLDEAPPKFRKIIPTVIIKTHNFAIRFHRDRRRRNFLTFT